MNRKTTPHLADSVAETLFIPLSMRARETGRPDAIVRDPLAVELTRRIDYDFSQFKHDNMSLTGVAVRTRYLDERTDAFILCHERPVAVFLGCGLDTRLKRLKHAGRAVCYELDLPEVIAFASVSFRPTTTTATSPRPCLTRHGWTNCVPATRGNPLCLSAKAWQCISTSGR